MATLPTYEYAGAQYADLPKISTAPQQAAVSGWNVLGQQLDRMAAFFHGEAVSEAQKAGAKYAIEMPPTPEQLETAKRTGQMPQVGGAGRYFMESYNKTSAHLLGTDILANFQNRQTDRLARMQAENTVDLNQFRKDIRDDIDGSVSAITALDPSIALQVKAQMATVGHAAYKQALTFDEKARQAAYQVGMADGISKLAPVMENVVTEYSKSGFSAEQIEMILTGMIDPYTNQTSIRLAGGNKFALEAWKVKEGVKKNAIIAKLSDREFAPTAGDAFKKFTAGDIGELTSIYNGMDADQKKSIREEMIKSFADEEQTRKIDLAIQADKDKKQLAAKSLEYLTAGGPRKREIINELVGAGTMTLQQAEDLLKPKDPPSNPRLFADLYFQINRGQINRFDQIIPYSNSLSRSEFESLVRSAADEDYRKVNERINREAGIHSPLINPTKEQAAMKVYLTNKTQELLKEQIPDPVTRVMRYRSATEALNEAMDMRKADAEVAKKDRKRKEAEDAIRGALGSSMPGLEIDQIQFDRVKLPNGRSLSKNEIDVLKAQQKIWKDNL